MVGERTGERHQIYLQSLYGASCCAVSEMFLVVFDPAKAKAVGLMLGGDNPEYSMTREMVDMAIKGILKFCRDFNAELLVTTSRRTPKAVEDLLKERLAGEERCRLLVIANERNIDEAVGGILDLSSLIVVSGESISMISEAVSSRKKVVAFELEKKKGAVTKHERALNGLGRDGYITVAKSTSLPQVMERVWRDASPVKRVDDLERIFAAVRRLI